MYLFENSGYDIKETAVNLMYLSGIILVIKGLTDSFHEMIFTVSGLLTLLISLGLLMISSKKE